MHIDARGGLMVFGRSAIERAAANEEFAKHLFDAMPSEFSDKCGQEAISLLGKPQSAKGVASDDLPYKGLTLEQRVPFNDCMQKEFVKLPYEERFAYSTIAKLPFQITNAKNAGRTEWPVAFRGMVDRLEDSKSLSMVAQALRERNLEPVVVHKSGLFFLPFLGGGIELRARLK